MRKLTLDLDALVVDTFEAGEPASPRGTVAAHENDELLGPPTEPCTQQSCQNTCGCPTWADNSCYPQTYCIG